MKYLAITAAAAGLLAAIPNAAAAQGSREYFVAHIGENDAPTQLSTSEAAYYRSVFRAIDAQQWSQVEDLLGDRRSGLLHSVARATFYLHASSPRVELREIEDWLETGRNLPMAAQLVRLGETRGLDNAPSLPREASFSSVGNFPRRVRPPTTNDGTMPASTRARILDAITNDSPARAQELLEDVNSRLSAGARAEWRQRVAFSYFIENMDNQALAMARTVSQGEGPWVAEGQWVAGLAAWRLSDCETAGEYFRSAAGNARNIELRAAALYWASRAALRCRQPDQSSQYLAEAAGNDQTLYGMLAAEQLGTILPARVSQADVSDEDWQRLQRLDNVRVAVALAEIGEDNISSAVLLHQARIGDASDFAALSRLARDLGLPQTQLSMAYNAPAGGRADPASFYPTPRWTPVNGWRVDPALAYAHILQESNFRAGARSPANAQGLMQITPITVRQHAPSLNMSSSVNIYDPSINLAFGQRNLEMLQDDSATHNQLPKIMAAYNAGLTPIRRWETEIRDFDDPLLYMEAIPYWETRGYVAIVMRNYWMYERQASTASPSRITLAENDWPEFPGAGTDTGNGNGRVYLSTGGN